MTVTAFDTMVSYIADGLENEPQKGELVTSRRLWKPNPDHEDGTPNPQRLAYESKADILGYGGSAGSGKSDLLLGIAATNHRDSIIFRKVFKNLRGIIRRSRQIFNPENVRHRDDRYNEALHRWALTGGRNIELESMQHEKDKENFRGFPHDFYGFDEVTEFSRSQVVFVIGWMRSTNLAQRCRCVMTFNPPHDEQGTWVIEFFLPWIAYLFPNDFNHPNPARPGELRWYATIDGKEKEFLTGEEIEHNGEVINPLSRTFIPGKLSDNPHLSNTNYRSVLQSLPEPFRSQVMYGDFAITGKEDPLQVIPLRWVKLAQKRWLEREKPDMPLSGAGLDVARGGVDSLVLSKRYGTYFDELISVPGINVEDGPMAAGIVYNELQYETHIGYINVDLIGVGTSPYDSLKAMYPNKTRAVNVSNTSNYIVMTKGDNPEPVLRMKNKRAEIHWRLREALDPVTGDDIALPDDNEITADLCAARYKMLAGGVIQIEKKEAIKKRINRSPDKGEAIMLSWFDDTPIAPGGDRINVNTDIYKSRRGGR